MAVMVTQTEPRGPGLCTPEGCALDEILKQVREFCVPEGKHWQGLGCERLCGPGDGTRWHSPASTCPCRRDAHSSEGQPEGAALCKGCPRVAWGVWNAGTNESFSCNDHMDELAPPSLCCSFQDSDSQDRVTLITYLLLSRGGHDPFLTVPRRLHNMGVGCF